MNSSHLKLTESSSIPPEPIIGPHSASGLRECIDAAIIGVDADGCIRMFNATAEKLLGLSASEVVARSIDVLPPFLKDVFQRTLSTGQPVSHCEIHPESPEGPAFTLTTAVLAGPIGGAVLLMNDLSAARTLEQKVAQLDRLASIGTLSASMAHEIKNALVAVRTFVELLLKQNKDSELAGIVAREMKRIDSIVSQMLRFAGPAKPTFAWVDVHDVVRHALRLIQHQIEGKKVRLTQRLTATKSLVMGDRYQLQQAFVNLFFNALEAMGARGELSISSDLVQPQGESGGTPAEADTRLRLVIQDNGIGISPQDLPKLFEPFFTTKSNGTGLGLSITRRIVQEHRGNISVQSEPNQGSSFSVIFPLLNERS